MELLIVPACLGPHRKWYRSICADVFWCRSGRAPCGSSGSNCSSDVSPNRSAYRQPYARRTEPSVDHRQLFYSDPAERSPGAEQRVNAERNQFPRSDQHHCSHEDYRGCPCCGHRRTVGSHHPTFFSQSFCPKWSAYLLTSEKVSLTAALLILFVAGHFQGFIDFLSIVADLTIVHISSSILVFEFLF